MLKDVKSAAKHEVGVRMTKVPRCPACFEKDGTVTPNPQALKQCPRCGADQPPPDYDAGLGKMTQPLLTRICYAIADFLNRLIGEPT